MTNSGRTASLVMGLPVKATVATGAKPKNSLILLASSGSIENAMNAGKQNRGGFAKSKYMHGSPVRTEIKA